MKLDRKKILITLLLLLAAAVSFFKAGEHFSNPETYSTVIASIDKKAGDAMRLTGTATVASAGITLLPDDVATPVADRVADFTGYFLAALCVLYAEKYMLPLIGYAVFKFLIPLVCALAIGQLWTHRRAGISRITAKLLVFAVILWLAIPVSIQASDLVYDTYQESIYSAIRETENLTQDISVFSVANGTSFLEQATTLVSRFVEALAITIATSCVVPILVLVFFVWLAKIILGVQVQVPLPVFRMRRRVPAAASAVLTGTVSGDK